MNKFAAGLAVSSLVLLAGCVSAPYGPTVPVVPAPGKPFAEFQREDAECQDYAYARVEGHARAANDRVVLDTVIGAALGTAVGAAVDNTGGAGPGAAIGATVGASVGANDAAYAQANIQGRYNILYAQCMSAKGNEVARPRPRRPRYDDYPPPPPPRY